MTNICVSKLTIIGSDNGLSPGRHQPIIWTNTGLLISGTVQTYFRKIFLFLRKWFSKRHFVEGRSYTRIGWVARGPLHLHGISLLTHCSRDKMATIPQMTFLNAFSWRKMFEFRLKFHWILFQGSNWQYISIGLDNGLALNRRQAIIWTNDG